MPKRSEEDESEWTIRKNDILDLYVEQDRSLSEVIRIMANQGFTRTKPQYERSLKRWRVSKNVRKEEWDFILSRMNQRQRPTTVKVRGITISQSRLERQKLRHRESTLDHYKSKLNPSPCCQTSPNIEISTPQPISKVDALQLVVSPEQYHDRKDTEEITRLESQRQAHVYQQTAEDVLNHSVDILVKAIVRHKTLSRRFRGIVRRSRDDFDLELLRRVLIATKLDDDWKMFGETLLFDAVKDGNRSLIDALLNAGVDDMASDGISSPSEFAEFLLATSPPLGSFENPMA